MGRRIEDMGTVTVGSTDVTTSGYIKDSVGLLAPTGFGGHIVEAIEVDTADDTVTVVLKTAVLGITALDFGANYHGVANAQVDLTTANGGKTFTGIDAGMTTLFDIAALGNIGVEVYFQCYDATVDLDDASDPATNLHQKTTEHGAWNETPVHEEGGLVRVGREPRDPVCYPNHRGGWDSANLSGDKYPLLPGQPT